MRAGLAIALLLAACGSGTVPSPRPRAVPRPPVPDPPTLPSTTTADLPPRPGTSGPEPAPPPVLRPPPSVWIALTKPAAAGRVRVQVKGAWSIVDAVGRAVGTGTGLDADLVLTAAYPTLAGKDFPADAELRPAGEGDLVLTVATAGKSESRTYAGGLRVDRGPDARWRPMIVCDIETYVTSVVNSEIPAAFPREAQRTQAILARTYALTSTVRTSPDAPLVLTDVGGTDQEFAGLAAVPAHRQVALDAVRSTAGLVLTDASGPFIAYYHSTCGGVTCPGEVVFGTRGAARALAGGVVCAWCGASKYFRWDVRVPAADVVKAAGLTGSLEEFRVAESTAGRRAVSFDVTAGGKTKRVRAAELRLRVGASKLRSVLLDDVLVAGGEIVVHGRGWGHGVGLCQMGAKSLAEQGETAERILAIYYPGASLERRW